MLINFYPSCPVIVEQKSGGIMPGAISVALWHKRPLMAVPRRKVKKIVIKRTVKPARKTPKGRKPRRGPGTTVAAARAFLDPALHTTAPPSENSLGNFTTLNAVSRWTFATSTTLTCIHVFSWTPSSLRCFRWVYNVGTGAVTDYSDGNLKFVPYLDVPNALPISIRPLRMSVRIRNQTVFTSISGTMQSLILPDPLDWTGNFNVGATLQPTAAMALAVYNLVQSSPHTRTYTAMDFSSSKSFIVPPASHVGYHNWENFVPAGAAEITPFVFAQQALINGQNSNAMGTFILVTPPSTASNTYAITLNTQDACRYSPLAVQHSFAKPQPWADGKQLHALHSAANAQPSVPNELLDMGLGYAAAKYGPRLGAAVRGGFNNMINAGVARFQRGALALRNGEVAMAAEEAAPLLEIM